MNTRTIDGFFYGLFMDSDVLCESGVEARNPRRAYVENYELRIGRRATLVAANGARSYGMLYALTHADLDRLYSDAGLTQYRPEAVLAQPIIGEPLPALCYNLQDVPKPDEVNSEYAARLREVLNKLDFPAEYVASVS